MKREIAIRFIFICALIGFVANGNLIAQVETVGPGNTAATKSFIATNSDHDTAMVVLDNGNVGIGKTNPSNLLDVNGTVGATKINTGLGNNELYDMNQDVTTTSTPTFNNLTLTGGLTTGESASGNTIKFGKKWSFMTDINPIVTCYSGYFWWDYSTRQVKFTETNAGNNYARFSGMKNEGSGPVLFDGIANSEGTSTVATLNVNLEYVSVEITSEIPNGGYIHLYCIYSNETFTAHYWFRFQ